MQGKWSSQNTCQMYKGHDDYVLTDDEEAKLSLEDYLRGKTLSDEELLRRVKQLEDFSGSNKDKKDYQKFLGVKFASPFLKLPAMKMEDLTNIDLMHFIMAVNKHLIKLLKGNIFLKQ